MLIDKKKFEDSIEYIKKVNKAENPDFSEFFENWEKAYEKFDFSWLSNSDFITSNFTTYHEEVVRK